MLKGNDLAEYCIKKIGTPYFYGAKMQPLTEQLAQRMHSLYPSIVTYDYIALARKQGQFGKINVDCSGLIGAFRGRHIGSSQLYSSAYKRLPINQWREFAPGTVLWRQGHVGVYIGNGELVEAKGIKSGTIKSKFVQSKWLYGLTFSDIEYEYTNKIYANGRRTNIYNDDHRILNMGCKGESVKWLQFELNEHGFGLDIDGEFGIRTKQALMQFQASAKITCDGICGTETRSALKR